MRISAPDSSSTLIDVFFGGFRLVRQAKGAPLVVMCHVVGKPVENLAHSYGDVGLGDIGAENGHAVGGGKNRLMHINADFAFIGIKGRDNLDVAGLIAPDLQWIRPTASSGFFPA